MLLSGEVLSLWLWHSMENEDKEQPCAFVSDAKHFFYVPGVIPWAESLS